MYGMYEKPQLLHNFTMREKKKKHSNYRLYVANAFALHNRKAATIAY